MFRSNPNFVFHDSCGFEAGGEDEFKKMKEFILERASTLKLKERIHAIWWVITLVRLYLMLILCGRYCIPMDECHRAITKAEERFFSECDTSSGTMITITPSTVWLIIHFCQFLWSQCSQNLMRYGTMHMNNSKIPDCHGTSPRQRLQSLRRGSSPK